MPIAHSLINQCGLGFGKKKATHSHYELPSINIGLLAKLK